MKDYSEARRALEPLRAQLLSVSEPDSELREQTVSHMHRLLERPGWPRRSLKSLAWLAAGCALMGAAAGLVFFKKFDASSATPALLQIAARGAVSISASSKPSAVRLGARAQVPAVGNLTTGEDASVTMLTPTGVAIDVSHDSELELERLADHENGSLTLLKGSVRCLVPKQAPGQSFSVQTSDAVINVEGTRFSVDAAGWDGRATTCVRVTEGIVVVRRGESIERLVAGASSGCASSVEPEAASPEPAPKPSSGAEAASQRNVPPRREPSGAVGSLTVESSLLRAALLSEQAGNAREARRSLDELLRRFPQSPLVAEAQRVRARLPSD